MIGVVGASGFIGGSVSEVLNQRGILHKGYVRSIKKTLKKSWPDVCQMSELTIGQPFEAKIFDDITTLILCVSSTRPGISNNSELRELNSNVVPHAQFLFDLLETKIDHIIFLSSGGTIYGNTFDQIPTTEDMPRNPCTAYGFGKLCIESALENIWGAKGRNYTIIRPSNPVGYRQFESVGSHGLITTAFSRIYRGETLNIYGDGNTIRDYFSVEDLAELLISIANSDHNHGNRIFNASSGIGTKTNEIITLCEKELGIKADVNYIYELSPKISYNVLSNELAREAFGWRPNCDMQKIVAGLNNSWTP